MSAKVSDSQGTMDKDVNTITVAGAEGAINKDVQNGYVSHVQGGIGKQFYANWHYVTGTILHSSSGSGDLDTVKNLTPDELSYDIKPYHIQTAAYVQTVDGGTTATVKMEVRYLNSSSNWVSLTSTTRTVTDVSQLMSLDFNVSEGIVTRQLNYRLVHLGGETVEYTSQYGKCTSWYTKG